MSPEDEKRLISKVGVRGNVRYITITDNKPEHWENLIYIAKTNYAWYAFIYHDQDGTEKHIHLMCYDKGGTNLKSHCDRFSSVVPSNFVLKVYNPRAMARYLIHKDNPEKHQYSFENVHTNNKDKLANFLADETSDVLDEYRDYKKVHSGVMTPEEFFEKYRSQMATVPFHHRVNLFHKLYNGFPNDMYDLPGSKMSSHYRALK